MAKTTKIEIRITEEDKDLIRKKASSLNFSSISEYCRFMALNGQALLPNMISKQKEYYDPFENGSIGGVYK